jgi:hypothetical protein
LGIDVRRSLLLTTVVLGTALSVVSGSGLFASLSDTARTGVNTVDTQALTGSADLKIAVGELVSVQDPTSPTGQRLQVQCGAYADDLESPLITLTNRVPGENPADHADGYFFCLQNVGSQTVNLAATSTELNDVELACTGDESEYDATCVSGQQGELSALTTVTFFGISCFDAASSENPPNAVAALATTVANPVAFGTLATNQARCFGSSIIFSGHTNAEEQAAQTDRLTWRYAFTGVV